MRISKPTYALKDGTIAIELENDLAILARSRDDFKYKLDKDTKPKGWKPEEVTRDVCKRYGVRIGHLAATKVRIKNLTLENKSPLAVIQRAYRREKEESGRRFVIEIRGGRLYVRPLQRSKEMLILGDTLLDATLELSHQHGFATALDVTGTVKDGDKKRKKVNMGIVSRGSALRRFGYIVRPYKLEDEVSSEAAGRKRARIQLQELAKENRELTFTHPGVATLRRGHALRLQIDEGFVRKHVVFVREVTHTVSAGAYEMSVTVAFDDPFIDMDDAIAKEKWPKKAKERGRKSPRRASHDDAHPQPKKAAQRASSRRPHRRVS